MSSCIRFSVRYERKVSSVLQNRSIDLVTIRVAHALYICHTSRALMRNLGAIQTSSGIGIWVLFMIQNWRTYWHTFWIFDTLIHCCIPLPVSAATVRTLSHHAVRSHSFHNSSSTFQCMLRLSHEYSTQVPILDSDVILLSLQ